MSKSVFPSELVEQLLLSIDSWDTPNDSPTVSARRLVRLRNAADDLSHFAAWHYVDLCAGCPAALKDKDSA